MNEWNENLRLARERHRYLQKELSQKINVSERTIQRYESGESEPTISVLLKLSELYDMSIDAIVGNETNYNFDIIKIEKHLREIETTCKTMRREMYESEIEKVI